MLPIRPALALLLVLMTPLVLGAQEPGDDLGESPERYAQVKVLEGDVTIHKGETDETLSRGLPVAEGDVLESRGRGILQLGDGSAVAFGPDTRFRVASLFSLQDQVQRVLLVLDRGELRVRKGTFSEALIRVDTPAGSGTLGDSAETRTRPDATWIVAAGQQGTKVTFLVHGGTAIFVNGRSQAQVFAGQRLTVYGSEDTLQRVADFNSFALDDFDLWADDLVKPRPSESAAKVPPEVRYYADGLDAAGSWSYVEDCDGYAWSPAGVGEDWRPYSDGCWGAYDGGLTWVGLEPWSFLTCHFGRWGWGRGHGWYWIPGIAYSPAWVAWHCTGGYFGWAPLGWGDRPCRRWDGRECWNIVGMGDLNARTFHGHLSNEPGVLQAFAAAPGWSRGRMMVARTEFHDPARFQSVLAQPALVQQRVAAYVKAAPPRTFVARAQGPDGRMEVEHPLMRPQTQRSFAAPQAGAQRATGEARGRAPRPFTGGATPANGAREMPAAPRPATSEPRPAPAEPRPAEPRPAPRPVPRNDDRGRGEARPEPARPAPAREPAHVEHTPAAEHPQPATKK